MLTSIRVVQAFAREDYEQQRFDAESLANVEAGLAGAQPQGQAGSRRRHHRRHRHVPGAVATARAWRWPDDLSAGVLIVFLLYLGKMYKPMRDLSKMTDTVSKAVVGYERIQEVLDIESRVRDAAGRATRRRRSRAASSSTTSASATATDTPF